MNQVHYLKCGLQLVVLRKCTDFYKINISGEYGAFGHFFNKLKELHAAYSVLNNDRAGPAIATKASGINWRVQNVVNSIASQLFQALLNWMLHGWSNPKDCVRWLICFCYLIGKSFGSLVLLNRRGYQSCAGPHVDRVDRILFTGRMSLRISLS